MGMFNDSVCAMRTGWSYTYKAEEILPYVHKLLEFHTAKELEARRKTSELLTDMTVNQNDSRFTELKRDITTHGTIKEQCEVFITEFERAPTKTYELGLGDVTFFGLTTKL